jgi:hypothetical protein
MGTLALAVEEEEEEEDGEWLIAPMRRWAVVWVCGLPRCEFRRSPGKSIALGGDLLVVGSGIAENIWTTLRAIADGNSADEVCRPIECKGTCLQEARETNLLYLRMRQDICCWWRGEAAEGVVGVVARRGGVSWTSRR